MDMERTLKEKPQGNEKMQLRYVSCDLEIDFVKVSIDNCHQDK